MVNLSIPLLPGATEEAGTRVLQNPDTAKARDAARQFEALLIGQMLRSVRESSGWGQSDAAGECATDFAEQQFARVLAEQGGLGLAALIAAGLERKPAAPAAPDQSRP